MMQPAWAMMMTMATSGHKASGSSVANAMPDHVRQLTVAHINLHFITKSQEASCNKTSATHIILPTIKGCMLKMVDLCLV